MGARVRMRVVTVIGFLLVAVVAWKWHDTSVQRDLAAFKTSRQEMELQQVQERNRDLAQRSLPQEELEKQRAEHQTLMQIRNEMKALQARQSQSQPVKLESGVPASHDILHEIVPPTAWQRKGLKTPAAATETVLWAAASKETDVLASALELEPSARPIAEKMLAALPTETRALYATPEQLLAALTEKDIPQGGAGITGAPNEATSEYTSTRLSLQNAAGEKRGLTLVWHRQGDEWRLMVQRQVVENYAAKLQGLPPPNPSSPWKP